MTKIIVVFPEIGLFLPADEGTTAFRNVGKYSLKDSSPLPSRPGSWATQLWRIHVFRSCLVTDLWQKCPLWFDYSPRTWGLRHQHDSFCSLFCYDAVWLGIWVQTFRSACTLTMEAEYSSETFVPTCRSQQCLFFYGLFSEAVSAQITQRGWVNVSMGHRWNVHRNPAGAIFTNTLVNTWNRVCWKFRVLYIYIYIHIYI